MIVRKPLLCAQSKVLFFSLIIRTEQASSGDAGNVDYKDLPLPGAQLYADDAKGADYSYDP